MLGWWIKAAMKKASKMVRETQTGICLGGTVYICMERDGKLQKGQMGSEALIHRSLEKTGQLNRSIKLKRGPARPNASGSGSNAALVGWACSCLQ